MEPVPRPNVSSIEPYRPGRPAPDEAGSLASNESAFGTSPLVQQAIREAGRRAHRYPDPLATNLREALAGELGTDPEGILVGNGSDELIYLVQLAYAAGGTTVCADPAYRLHEVASQVVGASIRRVPLRDWVHDLEAMAAVKADVAFICNPHNPTGTVVGAREVATFVEASSAGLVVVDEAYLDFCDDPSAVASLPLVSTGRVVVLRTFSKLFGLAGLRIGYAVASPSVVGVLRSIRPPFSVNTVAQAAAVAALRDRDHRATVRAAVIEGRRRLTELFSAAGYEVVPSQANFVLVRASDAEALEARLLADGVQVRPGSSLGVAGAVRVTVPGPAGMRRLADALRERTGP